MTYKAGDKVWYDKDIMIVDRIERGENILIKHNLTDTIGIYTTPKHIRPATPVEIAKQAVLDEVSSIANNSTDDFNHALNVLIETAILEGMERMKSTVFASSTPPIIGDETKLD